jgi:hypothetical protein
MASYKNSMGKFEWPGACPEPLTAGFRKFKKPAHGARTLFDNSLRVKLSRMQTNPYSGRKSGVKVVIVDLLGLIGQTSLYLSYEFTVSTVFYSHFQPAHENFSHHA